MNNFKILFTYFFLFALLFSMWGCDLRLRPNEEDTTTESFEVKRYDRLQSLYLQTGDYSALQQMNTTYPIETRTLIENVLQLGSVDDPDINSKFLIFYQDTTLQAVIKEAETLYADMDDLNQQFQFAFDKLQTFFPDFQVPMVYAQIGALDQSVVVGNNTVGIIDISSNDPKQWKHKACHIVDYQLKLNYSLTHSVNRDSGSGYALRGTVFTPDNHYLLVGCMGGGGGIAVIDLQKSEYLGRLQGMMANVRHLVLKNGYLYLSINTAGYVQKIALKTILEAIPKMQNKRGTVTGWQNCKVGSGARTIELSPSGKYIFAACNNASALYVVDANTMKVLTSIPADSYPVGLDVSKDGKYVFTTAQGHSGKGGGNAVDIFKVTYNTNPSNK